MLTHPVQTVLRPRAASCSLVATCAGAPRRPQPLHRRNVGSPLLFTPTTVPNASVAPAGGPIRQTIGGLIDAVDEGLARLRVASWRGVELRLLVQVGQVAASLVFVALYIWSTYEPVTRGSWRHTADLALCAVFAADLVARIKSAGVFWPRMLLTPLSLLDVLSFAPGVLELFGASWLGAGLLSAGVDLRWFRIFRALRLLRLCLLTGNLPLMKLSSSALLSGAVNVRLMQLVASVCALLFTSASLVHAVERLPWHDALYFVTTTLTTVGYGDVVVRTFAGRMIVLVFMAVGVVLIPVRTSQLWGQLASRRLTAGTLNPGRPVVLLSTRLSEVRGFADLTDEFFHQVRHQRFVPRDVHLMVLGNKPSYEFTAFQELHDQRITLVEGSVLSAADLVRCHAERASTVLVLGDRFTQDAAAEDLDVLFRVWAIKSYTKCVPLTVQVLRASALAKVVPFLDPHQDVVMSVEQMRHRLLALSALCPGASTLLGNLLHTAGPSRGLQDSALRPRGAPAPKLAGRSWFAEYVRGCGHDLHVVAVKPAAAAAAAATGAAAGVLPHLGSGGGGGGAGRRAGSNGVGGTAGSLVGCSFGSVVREAFQQRHLLVIGVLSGSGLEGRVVLNPPHTRRLLPSDQLVVCAPSEEYAEEAVRDPGVIAAAAATTAAAEVRAAEAEAEAAAAAATASVAAQAQAMFSSSGDDVSGSGSDEPGSGDDEAAGVYGNSIGARGGRSSSSSRRPRRVKRYLPSLASWDEDDDYYPDKEGSFFAAVREVERIKKLQERAAARRGAEEDWAAEVATKQQRGEAREAKEQKERKEREEERERLAAVPAAAEVPAEVAAAMEARRNEDLAPQPGLAAAATVVGAAAATATANLSERGGDDVRLPATTSRATAGTSTLGGNGGGGGSGGSLHASAAAQHKLAAASSSNVVAFSSGSSSWRSGSSTGSSGAGGSGVASGVASGSSSGSSTWVGSADSGGGSGSSSPGAVPAGISVSSRSHGSSSSSSNGSNNGNGSSNGAFVSSGASPSSSLSSLESPGLDAPAAAAAFEADIGVVHSVQSVQHRASSNTSSSSGSYSGSSITGSVSGVSTGGGSTVASSSNGVKINISLTTSTSNVAPSGAKTTARHGGSSGATAAPAAAAAVPATAQAAAAAMNAATAAKRTYTYADAPWRQPEYPEGGRRGHIILAGAIDSFVEFARVLHSCAGTKDPESGLSSLEVVVLHPSPPEATVLSLGAMGPTKVVRGSPADPKALEQAGAAQARCLVYLGHSERPGTGNRNSSEQSEAPINVDYGTTSRAGVLADAEALLTCYGVGEDVSSSMPAGADADGYASSGDEGSLPPASSSASTTPWNGGAAAGAGGAGFGGGRRGAYMGSGSFDGEREAAMDAQVLQQMQMQQQVQAGQQQYQQPYYGAGGMRGHSVVELSFTSSVRFLQPGLLLQGTSVWDESCSIGGFAARPRRSWRQRAEAEEAAAQQGLVQWQTNIYYGAGRVVVPALVDTFTIQAFAKRNLLLDVMAELCGDDGRPIGTLLRLLPVPRELAGRPYRELFDHVVLTHGAVPLGLYRSKPENPAWRLHFVSTNPAWEDVVSGDDRVFVLRSTSD